MSVQAEFEARRVSTKPGCRMHLQLERKRRRCLDRYSGALRWVEPAGPLRPTGRRSQWTGHLEHGIAAGI